MAEFSHSQVAGRKITRADFNERTTTLSGTANKYLGFDGSGNLAEKNPPAAGGFVSVTDFGATGDGLTDDLPAFEAALAYLRTLAPSTNAALHKSTPKLYVPTPAVHYYLSSTLNVSQCVHIFGDGSGAPNSEGTTLRFGDNCNGVVLNEYRTLGQGVGSVGDASGAIFEGFTLLGGNVGWNGTSFILGDGTSTSGAGLRMRGTGQIVRDVQIKFFAEDGLNNITVSGGANDVQGNGNNFHIEDVWALYNDGNGVRIKGTDSNAGSLRNINAIQNRLFGVRDDSFLGNQWDAVHTRDNGVVSSAIPANPTGMCIYAGQCYCVRIGQEAAASTTVPGTNEAVWYPSASHPYARPWVSGMQWAAGGPIAATDPNAYNLFNNAYAESGQGPIQAGSKTLFVGGAIHDTPIIDGPQGAGKAVWVRSLSGALVAPQFTSEDGAASLGGASWLKHTVSGKSHTVSVSSGKLNWIAADGGSSASVLSIDNANNTQSFTVTASRLRVSPFSAPNALGGGYGLNFISSTAGVNGETLIAGDQFYKASPTIGGNVGWVVTTGGVGGSSAVLTPTGIVGGVQAAAVAAPTGGGTVDTECRAQLSALIAALKASKLMSE